MLALDREAAIAAWRKAEARVYPTVMVNVELYRDYIGVVRAVAEMLGDVHTEDGLLEAYEERRELVREAIARDTPPMLALMDLGAVRDAAFCHRHREVTREQGQALAHERLERARREGAEWVVLFDDVTPLGSHTLEMHVRSGRALHASADLPLDARRPTFALEVVQLDPADGTWLLDKPPVMPSQSFETREEWEARIEQAHILFGES